jgi:hypothetical protein
MSIEQIKKLQPGSEAAISQLIADGLIEGPEAIAGKLLLTLKGRGAHGTDANTNSYQSSRVQAQRKQAAASGQRVRASGRGVG